MMNSSAHLGLGKLGVEAPSVQGDPTLPLKDRVINALKTVFDPEIPVDIYELGLIYLLEVSDEGEVNIQMTLTSPACPVAGSLPGEVQKKVESVAGVKSAKVELVWEPPWSQERMTEAARLELGFF
jgi:FeS assembly SUF system protein